MFVAKLKKKMVENEWWYFWDNDWFEIVCNWSSFSHGFDCEDEVWDKQLLLGFLDRLGHFFGDGSFESFVEEAGSLVSCKNIVFSFDFLILGNFVTLDGQHPEHFFLFIWISVVFDEQFKVLHLFHTEQSIKDLFIDPVSAILEQLSKHFPVEIRYTLCDVLGKRWYTLDRYFCNSARYN